MWCYTRRRRRFASLTLRSEDINPHKIFQPICDHFYLNSIVAYVYSKSEPAVEKSKNVRFAPYMIKFPGLDDLFAKSGIDFEENHWSEVY